MESNLEPLALETAPMLQNCDVALLIDGSFVVGSAIDRQDSVAIPPDDVGIREVGQERRPLVLLVAAPELD